MSLWDMGVTITADLMSSSQCIKSAATALLLLLLLVSHMTSNRSLSSRVNTSLPVKIHSISRPTARRVIGMVRRNFRHLDIDNFRLIYKTYIRPHNLPDNLPDKASPGETGSASIRVTQTEIVYKVTHLYNVFPIAA